MLVVNELRLKQKEYGSHN